MSIENADIESKINDKGIPETDQKFLDQQTLENLAAFFSGENNDSKNGSNSSNSDDENESNELKGDSPSKIPHKSRSRSRSKEKTSQRWQYCCGKCKKNDKKGKTCVCVVPASQRRVSLAKEGCSTCACTGCSKEDLSLKQSVAEQPNEPEEKKLSDFEDLSQSELERLRNGCCRECMKAFSLTGKACICQVPSSVRRRKLPVNGCVICGCHGCNPEDMRKRKDNRESDAILSLDDHSGKTSKKVKGLKVDDEYEPNFHRAKYSFDESEEPESNLENFDNSLFGSMMRSNFNLYPPLLGFGIPQRTFNYIYGRPASNQNSYYMQFKA